MSVTTPSSCTGTASPALFCPLCAPRARRPFALQGQQVRQSNPAQTPPGAPLASQLRPCHHGLSDPAAPAPWPATWRAAPAANRPATPARSVHCFAQRLWFNHRPCQVSGIHVPKPPLARHGVQRVNNSAGRIDRIRIRSDRQIRIRSDLGQTKSVGFSSIPSIHLSFHSR